MSGCVCTYRDLTPPVVCGRPAMHGHVFCHECLEIACIDGTTNEYGGPAPHPGFAEVTT